MRFAAGNFKDITDEDLQFVQQMGVSGIQINTPPYVELASRNKRGRYPFLR